MGVSCYVTNSAQTDIEQRYLPNFNLTKDLGVSEEDYRGSQITQKNEKVDVGSKAC